MAGIVVADSGPLHYLALIGIVHVLEHLFERLLIPKAVEVELTHCNTPIEVKGWMSQPKSRVSVKNISDVSPITGLHAGETETLRLAMEVNATAVLLDDRDARIAAKKLGLTSIGTIGILEIAHDRNLVDLRQAFQELRKTNFFISPEVLAAALARHQKRKKGAG